MAACQRTITPEQAIACMTFAGIAPWQQQEYSFMGTDGGSSICCVPGGAELYRIIPMEGGRASWVLIGWTEKELAIPGEDN